MLVCKMHALETWMSIYRQIVPHVSNQTVPCHAATTLSLKERATTLESTFFSITQMHGETRNDNF
jgi:hypothetical protein